MSHLYPDFATLLYTYISRFSVNPHYQQREKIQPTFAFTGESGYTLGFRGKIAHNGLHAETGSFRMGALSLPSNHFARFGNPAWPGVRTANFAAFGSWPGVLPKNAESLRNSDALMRVAVPRRRGPAGLRGLFRFCRSCGLYTLRSVLSECARRGVVWNAPSFLSLKSQ